MKILFTENGWNDYQWFYENNKKLFEKINTLIREAQREPYKGIGKPEILKGDLSGFISRIINDEHRLIYKISNDNLIIINCRFHYSKDK
ncbi:MAG: toxin YoeB [Bacteroidota bacterium]|nr:toxin YoeB [Bacteroidota bacterium]